MLIRQLSFISLLIIMFSVFIGCDSSSKEPGRYYNNGKGFSIKFPDGWSDQKPEMGILVQVSNPENTAKIGVQVQKIPVEKTLEEVFTFMKSFVYKQEGQLIKEGEADVSSNKSRWFTCRIGNEKLLEYLIKKDDYIYAIIFTSSLDKFTDDFENTMRGVAESFRFE